MWLATLLACRPGTEPTSPDPTPTETATTGTTGATGDTSGPTPEVPRIAEALADRCGDPSPRVWGIPGDDLKLVTLADAAARCNDGTPPVMWVRRATAPEHADDCVVHLDGGSFCADYETCAVRWCSDEFFDAGKMSSRWVLPARLGEGIQSRDPENAFAGHNQAFLHYCSSDFWAGRRADWVWDGDPPYRVDNSGHDMLAELLDALEAGVTSDDGTQTLPPLADAQLLLFGGSSAGGYGVAANLDYVAGRFASARVLGLPDAIFARPFDLMDPAAAALLADDVERLWNEAGDPAWDVFRDESCVAAATQPWDCFDLDAVFRGHLEVPWLLHHDLYDGTLYDSYQLALTQGEFARLGADGLRLYFAGDPLASVHGTTCSEHTVLDGTASFLRMSVVDELSGGPAITLH